MSVVEHSKCQKCQKVSNIFDLEDNDHGVGMICIDRKACKERIANNKSRVVDIIKIK